MDDVTFPLRNNSDITVSAVTGAMFLHNKNPRTGAPQAFLLLSSDIETLRSAIAVSETMHAAWRDRQ